MPDAPAEPMSYIAVCPTCGAIVEAFIDNPAHREQNAGHLADMYRAGFTVERVTSAYVREHWSACTCPHTAPQSDSQQMTLLE